MANIIVIGVVFTLDVLAFVLAIGAEHRRSTWELMMERFGESAGLREQRPQRAGVLRVRLRRGHGVRRLRAAAAARQPGGGHGGDQVLLLRPRAVAGPVARLLRRLLHRLLVHVRDRGAVPAGRVGPERVPHQVQHLLRGRPAPVRHAAQGRLRRRRRLHLPHRAPRRAALPLLRQGPRRRLRAAAHRLQLRHRHDPHVDATQGRAGHSLLPACTLPIVHSSHEPLSWPVRVSVLC